MAGRHFLFVPGPTNVPDRVTRAMMVAMEDHRSSKFPEFTLPLFQDLKKVFKSTDGQVFIFPSSGTGAWEASLCNTLSPGDKVLASRFGQFSHLWIDLAQRIGLDVQVLEEEWGTGVKPDKIETILRADKGHEIKAVLAVQNETATGVTSDILAVRQAMDAAEPSGNALRRWCELDRKHRFPHGRLARRSRGRRLAKRSYAAGWPWHRLREPPRARGL